MLPIQNFIKKGSKDIWSNAQNEVGYFAGNALFNLSRRNTRVRGNASRDGLGYVLEHQTEAGPKSICMHPVSLIVPNGSSV